MDLTAELHTGMSWRRFHTLLAGLSAGSRWQLALAGDAPDGTVLEGAAIDAYMSRLSRRSKDG